MLQVSLQPRVSAQLGAGCCRSMSLSESEFFLSAVSACTFLPLSTPRCFTHPPNKLHPSEALAENKGGKACKQYRL